MRPLVCLVALALSGCAFGAQGFGVAVAWTIGDASVGCAYSDDGYPQGGSDCLASGQISPQAAAALSDLSANESPEAP